ncbi:restriction endonuclease subunit S [Lonepinella sp. BR2882]|uniref:restriction endonuclease subunit S n=1 Tax=Lonepinella sp. BR2882 TaxID=3095283 RepID=UPI003F6E09DB
MNELKLTDREWKGFNIGDLFEIERGKRLIARDRIAGKVPYYSASNTNNGLTDFISNPLFIRKDRIVVSTFCDAFFVQGDFTASDEMTMLFHVKLNKYNGLFIAKIIQSNQSKFAFGRKAFSERVSKQKIILPINIDNSPDWQFMEDFIKQKEQKQVDEITDYYANQALSLMINTGNLKGVQWKEFFISDIFTKIQRGKRLIKSNQTDGLKPYVSLTALNNGVDNFIGNTDGVRSFENCLTLANSGSVGSTFFQHYEFVASDHVTALLLEKPNKYVYLFLSSVIKRLEEKYSFNREINDKRIQREKILLPVNSNNTPDWQFMADFMKKIEQDKIKTVLAYYDSTKNELGGGNTP